MPSKPFGTNIVRKPTLKSHNCYYTAQYIYYYVKTAIYIYIYTLSSHVTFSLREILRERERNRKIEDRLKKYKLMNIHF